MFTLDQMRMLDALARHGTITDAAAALDFTQPAASRLLARLQRACGVELVRRRGRGLELTDAGRLLAAHASRIAGHVAAVESDIRRLREPARPLVRVGAISTLLSSLMPRALALVDDTARAHIELRHVADSREAMSAVAAGELDLVVLWIDQENGADTGGLIARPLFSEDWLVALPTRHPRLSRRIIDLRELADEAWIVGAQSARERVLERVAARAGFTPRIAAHHDDQLVVQGLVAAGVGLALLPEGSLEVRHPAVHVRALEPAPSRRVVTAVFAGVSVVASARDAVLAALEEASSAFESMRHTRSGYP